MGNKVVKYAAGLLTAGVLGTAAIAQMVAVGTGTQIETVNYKMQENAEFYTTDNCGKQIGHFDLKDWVKGPEDSFSMHKFMYMKGYDGDVLLTALPYDNNKTGDKYYSDYASIYTRPKKGEAVWKVGCVKTDGSRIYLAKSDGMLLVHNGDVYEKYALSADGKSIVRMGTVKDTKINPTKIKFDRP